MKKLFSLVLLIIMLPASLVLAQKSPQEKGLETITMDAIQAQLEFLSSDWTEGRETGERGEFLAGDYIASMFKYVGVQPGGDVQMRFSRRSMDGGTPPALSRSYFQNFTLLETIPGNGSVLSLKNGSREFLFQENVDFRVSNSSVSTKFSGPVLFIGYGIKSDDLGLDDFVNTDLNGKIVIRLAGYPGMNNPESEMYKKINADRGGAMMINRSKNSALEGKGILAVIDISLTGDMGNSLGEYNFEINASPNEGRRSPVGWSRLRLDSPDMPNSPVTVSVTPKIMSAIMGSYNIAKYETDASKSGYKFKPVAIPGVTVGMDIETKVRRVNVRNIVAMVEGENSDEFIIVGAHADHMGMGGGLIWNGADDNASGTVGVMTIARAFAATGVKPKRTVLFCAWTGEEKGLLGSEYFSRNPPVGTIDQIKFYMNYDMISRDAANDTDKVNVGVTYNKDYPLLEEMSKRNTADYGLKMNYVYRAQENPSGGSDYTAFSNNKIPIIAVMAAMHPEYHTPNDEVSLINWDKMLDIIKLGFLNMWEIANSDFNK